jgi:hypothetical protein
MVDFDHTFNMLKMHIKKEIVDNYFAERAYLEEDLEVLAKKEEEYEQEFYRALPIFAAFYQLVPTNAAVSAILQLWGVTERPLSPEVNQVSQEEKQAVLDNYKAHGWTARGRLKRQIFDLYNDLQKTALSLRKKQQQVAAHCELYNEDVEKFNQNFDFNLISSQIEAMEGTDMPMEGSITALDREAMAERMRLRKKVLKSCVLVSMPELPPLADIKKKLARIIDQNL